MYFFDAHKVLPNNYKKYVKPFEHQMKNDKLEELIKQTNKRDKKEHMKDFLWYSLASLLVLPLMLILVFVFKMETTTAAIIAIIGLLLGQTFASPFTKQRKQIKYQKIEANISKEERMYFDYLMMFDNLLKDRKLIALIKSETDEEKNIIIDCIKKNKPIPEEILNKQQGKKAKKKDKKEK